ncbi:malto-oligosyltrehalose synthase [Monashia sp. NPDC004114]
MRGREVPVSTYRLQLEPGFAFDDAAAQVDYLAALGISHLYLSPVLQAAPGSLHGYDVVDPTRLSDDLGGEAGFARLVDVARQAGLGIVVDVVPNHMTTPTPLRQNRPLWSVLRDGRRSPYAAWFDIDWGAQGGRVLLPVLGGSLKDALRAGEVTIGRVDDEPAVRYYDHVFPVAPGTDLAAPLADVLTAQHYRLASWRTGASDLNYRRFFDVTSLIAVRVEDPAVFEATHALLLRQVRTGAVAGLRIDHPDGLADPEGYLDALADATDGAWVVVEKILEGNERLPVSWRTAGTTGYDAMLRIGGLFVDPAAADPLADVAAEVLGERQDLSRMVTEAKRYVIEKVLVAEVNRLMRVIGRALPRLDQARARRVVEALLLGMDRYRVYVRPGEPPSGAAAVQLESAAARAVETVGELDRAVLDPIIDLALGQAPGADPAAQAEFIVRFQQTCGPVMAKAVEDTVFYRYVRLVALNEVGGDPGHVGVGVPVFHGFSGSLLAEWPTSLTTLSTHDTKRSEDVRARLFVMSEHPAAWAEWVRDARRLLADVRPAGLDPATEYLLLQTLVGCWPVSRDRLSAYAQKATREAKMRTTWTDPDAAYEEAVEAYVNQLVSDPGVAAHVEGLLQRTTAEVRANTLGQKLVQLTMPGVADVYQGCELVDLSLVDPDNRRRVDYAERRRRLGRLDGGGAPTDLADEKLLVTTAALRARKDRPECFVGPGATYLALDTGSPHAVAFGRGPGGAGEGGGRPDEAIDVVTVVTRLAGQLSDAGGFGEATLDLPSGTWSDLLSGRTHEGGPTLLRRLVGSGAGGVGLPVALLVRVRDRA